MYFVLELHFGLIFLVYYDEFTIDKNRSSRIKSSGQI